MGDSTSLISDLTSHIQFAICFGFRIYLQGLDAKFGLLSLGA
jgi:hypothetical protein